MTDLPETRASDGDRWDVDARLQQAVGDGLISLPEYDERVGRVYAAVTRADLDAVTRDLPSAPVPPPPPAAPAAVTRPRRSLAVMSGDELRGPVLPGQPVEAYAVMGGSEVDLRREDLPDRVHLRAIAVMGGIEVLVPRGVAVHLTGVALMSGRSVDVVDPRPGAPVIEVSAWALMGGVEVSHGAKDKAVDLAKRSPSSSTALPPATQEHRRGGRRLRALVAAALVVAGVVGATQLDGGSVLGSSVQRPMTSGSYDYGSLFGSLTVVVPDNAIVTSGGIRLLGSSDCEACGTPFTATDDPQPRIDIDTYGAFGSVKVVRLRDYRPDSD